MKLNVVMSLTDEERKTLLVAHSVLTEIEHLYDGVSKERCDTFGHAASYLLDIINGEDVLEIEEV